MHVQTVHSVLHFTSEFLNPHSLTTHTCADTESALCASLHVRISQPSQFNNTHLCRHTADVSLPSAHDTSTFPLAVSAQCSLRIRRSLQCSKMCILLPPAVGESPDTLQKDFYAQNRTENHHLSVVTNCLFTHSLVDLDSVLRLAFATQDPPCRSDNRRTSNLVKQRSTAKITRR
jgi:hypothetical protein